MAGGACYVAYDSGLLGESEKGSEILSKAKAAIPPAVEEWMKYFGFEVYPFIDGSVAPVSIYWFSFALNAPAKLIRVFNYFLPAASHLSLQICLHN